MAVIIDLEQPQMPQIQLPMASSPTTLPPYIGQRSNSNVSESTATTVTTGSNGQQSRPSSASRHNGGIAVRQARTGSDVPTNPSSSYSRSYQMTQLQDFMRELGLYDEETAALRRESDFDVANGEQIDIFNADEEEDEDSLLIDRGAFQEFESEDNYRQSLSDTHSMLSPRQMFLSSSPRTGLSSGMPQSPPHFALGPSLRFDNKHDSDTHVSALTTGLNRSRVSNAGTVAETGAETREKKKKKRKSNKVIDSATNLQVFAQYPVDTGSDVEPQEGDLPLPSVGSSKSAASGSINIVNSRNKTSSLSSSYQSPPSFELLSPFAMSTRKSNRTHQNPSLQSPIL